MRVKFHGVRGSTPCHGPDTARYGGNTACVSVTVDGEDPLLFDLGTGLRYFAREWTSAHAAPFRGTALVTHLHWDHVQGLPFFFPLLSTEARIAVHGPAQPGSSFGEALSATVRPPIFPVTFADYPGAIEFHDAAPGEFSLGGFRVTVRDVPHIGPTVGYRVEHGGRSVVYVSDHQQPAGSAFSLAPAVRELAEGADLLIHDAQYTPREFESRSHWGHCTQDYAVAVSASCGVKRLALFHHDPERTDDELDAFASCSAVAGAGGPEVFAAREGLVVEL